MMHNSVRAGKEAARIRRANPISDGRLGLELLLNPRSSSNKMSPTEVTLDIFAFISISNE